MKGVRGIPDDKAKLLKDVLSEYGFKGHNVKRLCDGRASRHKRLLNHKS
jgi:hypothetical protein